MAKSDEPVTIKKYANRRLYNTGTSTYVTLEDLAVMVKAGEDFVVYDAKTGEDITRSVLAQIIFEQENKEGQNLLPITFLRQLIRFYGDSMQMLVPRYLEVSIDSLTREQEKFRDQMAQAFGGGGVRRAGGPGPPQHGDVRARLRDVHAVRAPRGAGGAEADKPTSGTPRPRRGGSDEIDDLKRQMDEMQQAPRAPRATRTRRRAPSTADRARLTFSAWRRPATAAPARRARPARPADSRSPSRRESPPLPRPAPIRRRS